MFVRDFGTEPPGTPFNLNPCRVLDTRQPAGSSPFSGEKDVNVTTIVETVCLLGVSMERNSSTRFRGPRGRRLRECLGSGPSPLLRVGGWPANRGLRRELGGPPAGGHWENP
jgi:hypothetical protein